MTHPPTAARALTEVVGVDVARGRWVGVVLRGGAFADALVVEELRVLTERFADAAVVGVDIPIGLPERGVRESDRLARRRLGARRASVFPAPPRAVLLAATHAEATALGVELTGSGVSQQAYGLRHRVLEAEPVAAADPRVVEVHPELSFSHLAGLREGGLPAAKRTWDGAALRRRLLVERAGIELPDRMPGGAGAVPVDDVLDAAVAAWSAARVAAGTAVPFPPGAQRGERQVIWA